MKVEEAWSIGDIFNGMMVFTNSIGLFGLAGLAILSVKSYLNKIDSDKKQGQYSIK
jgi:AGCS family alanine or glycine:cation symporter